MRLRRPRRRCEMNSYSCKTDALELAKEMEGIGVRTWEMSADQIRLLYYAFRGESDEVRRAARGWVAFPKHATWRRRAGRALNGYRTARR